MSTAVRTMTAGLLHVDPAGFIPMHEIWLCK